MNKGNLSDGDLYKTKKERKSIFSYDGRLMYFLTKAGELILLNIVFLITLLPVFTFGCACSSLYYATVKNIRKSRGYTVKEYFYSFKRTLLNGSIVSIISLLWCSALIYLMKLGSSYIRISAALLALTAMLLMYLFPVMSRFTLGITGCIKLSFLMMIRYIGYTLLMLLGTAALIYIYIFYIPYLTILFLPALWCLAMSFIMERVLRHYMPKPNEDTENEWYYG